MFDSEYNTDSFKSLKISNGAIIKNPEMLRFVPDHLNTKKMRKHTVKKLSFVISMFLIDIKLKKGVTKLF